MNKVYIIELVKYKLRFFVNGKNLSGIPKNTLYEIESTVEPNVGKYHKLYGGFYQGFYKLFGYDYETFPERVDKGWTVELLLKP